MADDPGSVLASKNPDMEGEIEKRLTGAESDVAGVKDLLRVIKKDSDDKFTSLFASIKEARNRIVELGKPQWQVWSLFGAGLLAMVTMMGSGYVRDQEKIEATLGALGTRFILHTGNGHPAGVIKATENNEKSISQMDATLQREMRILDDQQASGLDEMDRRLQAEMRLLNDSQNVRIGNIENQFDRVFNWQESHDQRVVGLNAAQWERIRALERAIFGQSAGVEFGKPPGS